MKHVDGKVAFITGAANGAGFGMAQVFAKNGMKVVITDIRQDSLDRAMNHFSDNPNVHPIRLDVTDRKARIDAIESLKRMIRSWLDEMFPTMPEEEKIERAEVSAPL